MSSIIQLKNITKHTFKYLNKFVPIILGEKDPLYIHNKYILKNNIIPSENTFEGKLSCGATCYVLDNYLKRHGIYTKLMITNNNYGEYFEDHCFLMKDNIIIDPTFRQFFSAKINSCNEYTKLLFETLPFIFIGTTQDLINMYHKLNNMHYKVYGKKFDWEIDDYWGNPNDISFKLDMNKVIKDKEYAIKKGKLFVKLHNNY